MYADIDSRVRQAAEADKVKLTEKKIENEVKGSEEYVTAQASFIRSERNANIMKGVLAALRFKTDCLLNIGHTQRQLMKSET